MLFSRTRLCAGLLLCCLLPGCGAQLPSLSAFEAARQESAASVSAPAENTAPEESPSPQGPLWEGAAPDSAPGEGAGSSSLSGIEQARQRLETSILAQEAGCTLRGISQEDFLAAYDQIQCDPRLFGISGCSYLSLLGSISVTWKWQYSDFAARLRQAEAAADGLLAGLDPAADDWHKALYVHDRLCSSITYTYRGNGLDQDIYAALVDKACVCNGYSMAFAYLMDRLGIPCALISGTADGDSHSWNSLTLDGETCYVDVTWDDLDEGGKGRQLTLYDWFCVSSTDIALRHEPEQPAQPVPPPFEDANYFRHEGFWLEEYDQKLLQQILAAQRGSATLHLRCGSEACYRQVQASLEDSRLCADLFTGAGFQLTAFSYATDPTLKTFTFLV